MTTNGATESDVGPGHGVTGAVPSLLTYASPANRQFVRTPGSPGLGYAGNPAGDVGVAGHDPNSHVPGGWGDSYTTCGDSSARRPTDCHATAPPPDINPSSRRSP